MSNHLKNHKHPNPLDKTTAEKIAAAQLKRADEIESLKPSVIRRTRDALEDTLDFEQIIVLCGTCRKKVETALKKAEESGAPGETIETALRQTEIRALLYHNGKMIADEMQGSGMLDILDKADVKRHRDILVLKVKKQTGDMSLEDGKDLSLLTFLEALLSETIRVVGDENFVEYVIDAWERAEDEAEEETTEEDEEEHRGYGKDSLPPWMIQRKAS